MDEYINREAAARLLAALEISPPIMDNAPAFNAAMNKAVVAITKLPAADVAPVVHGQWELKIEGYGPDACGEYWEEAFLVCSECGRREEVDIDVTFSEKRFKAAIERFPYCHCGAKMDLEV